MARSLSPRRSKNAKLRFEALEGRLMLNGDVTVKVNRFGDLSIHGDASGNGVAITQNANGTYDIVGIDAGATPKPTTINGKAFVTVTVRRNVTIDLASGPNLLAIGGDTTTVAVPGQLTIRTGAGNDQVQLSGVDIKLGTVISTGKGNDQVRLYTVSTKKSADVRMGAGADAVFVESANFLKNFRVRGGTGDDLVAVGADSMVGRDTSIRTGSGKDTVAVLGLTTGNHFGLHTGTSADTVTMAPQSMVTSKSDPDDAVTASLDSFATAHAAKFSADGNFTAAKNQFLSSTATVDTPLTAKVAGVHLGFGDDNLAMTDNDIGRSGIGGGLGKDTLYTLGQFSKNAVYGPTLIAHFQRFPSP